MAYKAFVSSTFIDLQKHREYTIEALRKAGFFVDPMEDWTATSNEPKAFSQARLDGCDLCVLLVGFRRGHIPNGETYSITQLEYKAAREREIEILVFLLREDAPWPRKYDEMDKDPKVKRWRNELQQKHGVSFFGLDPASIDVAPALTRWLAEKETRTGANPYNYQLLLELQPDLAALERRCSKGNPGKALHELRKAIALRLRTLAERSGNNETGNPPMEALRRLGIAGIIPIEALRSLEYALTITGKTLYSKSVDRRESINAVRAAAIAFNAINMSDPRSPQFRVKTTGRERYFFIFSIDDKVVISSEAYHSRQNALYGLDATRRYIEAGRIKERIANNGSPYFVIVAPNGEILAQSELFRSNRAMERAREAVAQFAPKAPTVIITG